MTSPSVLIVGAGIAGLACARALVKAGRSVRVVDRGRAPGGRMASRTLHGRPVDLGAAYIDASAASAFRPVVDDWVDRGLLRPWAGRYAAPAGSRSLLVDLAVGLDVQPEHAVSSVEPGAVADGREYDAVVLAMPSPQADRLVAAPSATRIRWEPVLSIALGWDRRDWSDGLALLDVDGSPTITLIADDGARRGDAAPVLVAHTTDEFAATHLDAPDGAIADVTAAVSAVLGIRSAPVWTHAHRWTFARPASSHPEPHLLIDGVGRCGDEWGGDAPTVESAWLSGDALGRALAQRAAD